MINVQDYGLVTSSRKCRKKIRRNEEDTVEDVGLVGLVRTSDKISENLSVRTIRKIDSYCSGPEALGLQEKLKIFEKKSRKEIGKEVSRNSEEDPSKESTRKKILMIEKKEGKRKNKEENDRKKINEIERKYGKVERNPWNGIERKMLGISPRGEIGKNHRNEKATDIGFFTAI